MALATGAVMSLAGGAAKRSRDRKDMKMVQEALDQKQCYTDLTLSFQWKNCRV